MHACGCWTDAALRHAHVTAAGCRTLGLLPFGHRSDSSFTAVYKPPNPPPRMHTRGASPVLPAALEYAAVDTDRCRRRCLSLPAPRAKTQELLEVGGTAAGVVMLRAVRALPATGICERQMPVQQRRTARRQRCRQLHGVHAGEQVLPLVPRQLKGPLLISGQLTGTAACAAHSLEVTDALPCSSPIRSHPLRHWPTKC
jgi:hypothetical protein